MPSPIASPSPSPSPTVMSPDKPMTAQDIRQAIDTGAGAREQGDYQTGQQKLEQAFKGAVALKDQALSVEAGNNLSIQYRLSAGRANRTGHTADAHTFSQKSLAVYKTLENLGWFSDADPNIERNWGHALLYAGKVNEAIPVLKHSLQLQTTQAGQGDESDHLAASYIAQGKLADAQKLLDFGVNAIAKNNGSKVWQTFGMMAQATLYAKTGKASKAKETLNAAMDIAKQNNLIVRQEELNYLLSLPDSEVNVLEAVGTPN